MPPSPTMASEILRLPRLQAMPPLPIMPRSFSMAARPQAMAPLPTLVRLRNIFATHATAGNGYLYQPWRRSQRGRWRIRRLQRGHRGQCHLYQQRRRGQRRIPRARLIQPRRRGQRHADRQRRSGRRCGRFDCVSLWRSTGGTARVEVFGNGNLDISQQNAPGRDDRLDRRQMAWSFSGQIT